MGEEDGDVEAEEEQRGRPARPILTHFDGRDQLIGYPAWVKSPPRECYTHDERQKKSRVPALAAAQRGKSSLISFDVGP